MNIAHAVIELCTFPADFSNEDVDKFAGEIQAVAGRYFPKDSDVESLVEDITGNSKSITVKFGKQTSKAADGKKIVYDFRMSVLLMVFGVIRVRKLTSFVFPIDLSKKATFWVTWNRSPKTEVAPATSTSAV